MYLLVAHILLRDGGNSIVSLLYDVIKFSSLYSASHKTVLTGDLGKLLECQYLLLFYQYAAKPKSPCV